MDLYLVVIGIVGLVVAWKVEAPADDVTPVGMFRRAMRWGCFVGGPVAILLGLRGILTGR